MKNLFKTTLYLSVFALAGILFQISCSNSENRVSSPSSTPIGKLIYYKRLVNGANPGAIYTCNYDGTNETMINITLPSGVLLSGDLGDLNVRLSPDGQKVFFIATNSLSHKLLYSCDITGTNPTEVINFNDNGAVSLGGAY